VYNKTKEFVLGQHQNVSGHHQTHLARAIGQSMKKDADTTFFCTISNQGFYFSFGTISPKSDQKKLASTSPKEFFFLKNQDFRRIEMFLKSRIASMIIHTQTSVTRTKMSKCYLAKRR